MNKLAPSVVRIEATQVPHGRRGMGSGVVVAQDRVATSCHVVRHAGSVVVISRAQRWESVGLQAHPQRDVCVLTVPGLDLPPVTLAVTDALERGKPVLALGFSGGFVLSPSVGKVAATYAFDGAHVIQTDAGFTSGASGGGLFDEAGQLLGLLTFRLPARGAYFFVVPVEWVARANAAETTTLAPRVGVASFWEGRPDELPYFLRASSLEAAGNVPDLLELTALWLEEEPGNPQARAFRQRALSATP